MRRGSWLGGVAKFLRWGVGRIRRGVMGDCQDEMGFFMIMMGISLCLIVDDAGAVNLDDKFCEDVLINV